MCKKGKKGKQLNYHEKQSNKFKFYEKKINKLLKEQQLDFDLGSWK